MMGGTRLFHVGYDMLILLHVVIAFASYVNGAAIPGQLPAAPLSSTTSSSTFPSGLPVPPSKTPAATLRQEEANIPSSNNQPVPELESLEQSAAPNQVYASGSSLATTDNHIAHNQLDQHSNKFDGDSRGNGEAGKIDGEKVASYIDFPPFSKQIAPEARYQRQRRSYQLPSSGPSYRFTNPEELELRLDDERDREALLRLMSLVANPEADDYNHDDTEGDGVDDDSFDLGTFQRPVASPYWNPSGRPSLEQINLMSSLLAAEPPRSNAGPHHLYGGERPVLPLDIGLSRRTLPPLSRDDDEDDDGEWLEDAIPLHGSHYKTRRSGPVANSEFTFNPVKSHFRRYLRAVPLKSGRGLEFMQNGGGQFGPVARFNRRRRAIAAKPAVHWM